MSRSIWTAASDLDWYDEGEPWQECGGCGRRDAERRMTCENAGTLAVWWCVECAADVTEAHMEACRCLIDASM